MNKNEEEYTTGIFNKQNLIIVPDLYFEEFLDNITESRIKSLYLNLNYMNQKVI